MGGSERKLGGSGLPNDVPAGGSSSGGASSAPGMRTRTGALPLVLARPLAPARPPSTGRLLLPDANHPARNDVDGDQVIQTDKTVGRGIGALGGSKAWKGLATVTESVDLPDDSGDTLHIDVTYRLETRPAEIGEIPDIWIHTERRALLTAGSGEHAGATIVGQARVQIGPDDALNPKAAIAMASIGAEHWASIYLAEPEQYVSLHGPGGRASLVADAAGNDVLAYDDPLRMLVGLRNILKQQHVAGHGADVSKMHARAVKLLEEARLGRAELEKALQDITTYHDRPTTLPVQWTAVDMADWLAENKAHGRDHTEDARLLRTAHGELRRLLDDVANAKAPERNQLDDALDAPVRFTERTAKGSPSSRAAQARRLRSSRW